MYKVAVIGYRAQGSIHHAPAFARVPDCRIVAICDVVEDRAKEGAEKYGATAYMDVDKLLEQEEFDIANIPVGEKYRHELVMKCLRRGKHIFTEKPLAAEDGQFAIKLSDVPVAREMVDEWQKHEGLQFGICFGLHASANVVRAKEVIAGGELGDFAGMHVITQHNSWNHIIDLVRYFGGEVTGVAAYADDQDEMSAKTATLKFENGGLATLASYKRLALQFQIKWIGTKGEIIVNNIAGDAYWYLHDSLETRVYDETRTVKRCSYKAIFEGLIAEFVSSIREGSDFVADGWAGLRHMEIDAAITESIRTGQFATVNRYRPEMGRRPIG
ncbi:MAG: Gfo/Idh/MocA family oxidoreductase [Planctomycetes bacterium]|nr:Gfo/Idh/MocA family oxidoreductase [Planctomycetota bacterium]